MVYFVPQTGGFIPAAWKDDGTYNASTWPGDAVLLTSEEQATYWKQPTPPGKCLGVEGGRPAWAEASTALTAEALAARERAWRDVRVSATEWLVTRHRDEREMELSTALAQAQFAELLVYRQNLRDWPQSPDFPNLAHRPSEPSWLVGLNS